MSKSQTPLRSKILWKKVISSTSLCVQGWSGEGSSPRQPAEPQTCSGLVWNNSLKEKLICHLIYMQPPLSAPSSAETSLSSNQSSGILTPNLRVIHNHSQPCEFKTQCVMSAGDRKTKLSSVVRANFCLNFKFPGIYNPTCLLPCSVKLEMSFIYSASESLSASKTGLIFSFFIKNV